MSATIKNLGEGQLPAAKGTLYAVPANTSAVVLSIILVNTDSVDRAVNIYYKKSGGTSRRLIPANTLAIAGRKLTIEEKITMAAGDAIEGDAAVASIVDYDVNGVERSTTAPAPSADDWDVVLYAERNINAPTTGTIEEVLEIVAIPGGTFTGDYVGFEVSATYNCAANTNSKTGNLRFGGLAGTIIATITGDTVSGNRFSLSFRAMASGASTMTGNGTYTRVTGSSGVYAIDLTGITFSSPIDIVATGLTATAAGDLILTSMRVALLRRVV